MIFSWLRKSAKRPEKTDEVDTPESSFRERLEQAESLNKELDEALQKMRRCRKARLENLEELEGT